MTSPVPTGRVRTAADGGHEIVYLRTFHAPIQDVWASITESERTARWFASWSGGPRPGPHGRVPPRRRGRRTIRGTHHRRV